MQGAQLAPYVAASTISKGPAMSWQFFILSAHSALIVIQSCSYSLLQYLSN